MTLNVAASIYKGTEIAQNRSPNYGLQRDSINPSGTWMFPCEYNLSYRIENEITSGIHISQ